jgi:hypothetical protein
MAAMVVVMVADGRACVKEKEGKEGERGGRKRAPKAVARKKKEKKKVATPLTHLQVLGQFLLRQC